MCIKYIFIEKKSNKRGFQQMIFKNHRETYWYYKYNELTRWDKLHNLVGVYYIMYIIFEYTSDVGSDDTLTSPYGNQSKRTLYLTEYFLLNFQNINTFNKT